MTDFLDRYGEQLRTAELPRPRRALRRGVIASFAVLAVAAPTFALTAPDRPSLEDSFSVLQGARTELPGGFELRRTGGELCVVGRAARACTPESRAAAGGVVALSGSDGATRFTGVVPDSVARVRFSPTTGAAVESPVNGNFFTLVVARTRVSHVAPPPTDWTAPRGRNGRVLDDVVPSGTFEWLDSKGAVIGPERS